MSSRKPVLIGLVLLLPLAFVLGRLTLAQDLKKPKPETVRAQRYRIVYAESGLDLGHGGGVWVEELYFPEQKVACFQIWEYPPISDWKAGEKPVMHSRLVALHQDGPRNNLTGLTGAKPSKIEEVRVPADLAAEIFALAKLKDRYDRECLRLGLAAAAKKVLRRVPTDAEKKK